ncbi:MAG: VCBS repeat-containing protein, partial [Magnetococcales bacterium]|nr:VCBS repeat-containing protein [Magnetococcales bacterium]
MVGRMYFKRLNQALSGALFRGGYSSSKHCEENASTPPPDTLPILLEPRILLDAAGVVSALVDPAALATTTPIIDPADTPFDDACSCVSPVSTEEGGSERSGIPEQFVPAALEPPREILFIDAALHDHETLLSGFHDGIEVVVLDATGSGLDRITETLAQRDALATIHILSHGDAGRLFLGSDVVDGDRLEEQQQQVTSWAGALTEDADILLYGCDVGQGAQGEAFVTALAAMTGADVAASDDATGSEDLGGDWTLEVHAGSVTAITGVPVSTYDHLLTASFNTAQSIGQHASSVDRVIVIDMDGDGDKDVVSASQDNHSIYWHKNNGSQSFTTQTASTTATSVESITITDLDGDGDKDILYTSINSGNGVYWLKNDGNQNFTTQTISTTAVYPYSVVVADMDGDGDKDIVAAYDAQDDQVVWLQNDGSQNFTETVLFSSSTMTTNHVKVGDMDNDGDMDIVAIGTKTATGFGHVTWLQNNGSQSFSDTTLTTPSTTFRMARIVDLDKDGHRDMVVSSPANDAVYWFKNSGSSSFSLNTLTTNITHPTALSIADGDKDGDLDIAVHTSSQGNLYWMENDGSQAFNPILVASGVGTTSTMRFSDLDGDGDRDMVVGLADGSIVWYGNQGSSGTAAFRDSGQSLGARDGSDVAVGDLDGDGDLDLFVANGQEGGAADDTYRNQVWLNDGSGTFTDNGQAGSFGNNDYNTSVALGDVDGDGDLDALLGRRLG